jgi:drug/metabolite transporter (DMT)-like permease
MSASPGSSRRGISFALTSAVMLGLAPVFGKQAILAGLPPLSVVALRTIGAAALILITLALFRRNLFAIYPAGLIGCALAGSLNGIGSLLYYSALGLIDASIVQLLFTTYPLFVALLLALDGQRHSWMSLFRLGLSLAAAGLLLFHPAAQVNLFGAALALAAGLLFALHIPINQRILYDVPPPTVTFYTLLAMMVVVGPACLFSANPPEAFDPPALTALVGLTLVTFLSRLALFMGVKIIGGLQTALLTLTELLITLSIAHWWLGESLQLMQWIGAGLLAVSVLLAAAERPAAPEQRRSRGWLRWLQPPGGPQAPAAVRNP